MNRPGAQAFYLPTAPDSAADQFVATPLTRGPWSRDHQHGGPPAALLTGAMVRAVSGYSLARVSVELLRPVPVGPVQITIQPGHRGRQVHRVTGSLCVAGQQLVTARALFIRDAPLAPEPPQAEPTSQVALRPWPAPDSLPSYVFNFFTEPVGYHTAVDLRLTAGRWGHVPVGFWTAPRVPLVAGRPTLPEEAVIILADAQSGMGVPRDPSSHTFVNPDLTVYFARRPQPGWIGFDVQASAGPNGAGLAHSTLRDAQGAFGLSAQSLVVRAR